MNNQPLTTFLNQVILDIQNNNLNPQQILHLTSFYCNYTSSSIIENNNNNNNNRVFSPSVYELLTAGIVFYNSLTSELDVELNVDTNEVKDEN